MITFKDFFGNREWEIQSKNPEFIFEILKNPINAIRPSKRFRQTARIKRNITIRKRIK
jgi:hypothetical protein